MSTLRIFNLLLLIAYPVAWLAPLLKAGLLPLFGLSEISIHSGIMSLLKTDVFLALIVAVFALLAPIAKVIATEAAFGGWLPARLKTPLNTIARLAMADVFLIAIYITAIKGVGVGRVETAWGLYLFTACILASLAISMAQTAQRKT